MSVVLREPVPNTTPNLGDKIQVAFLGQVSEITNQVRDGVLFNGAAALLKNRERLGGGDNVFGFIDHVPLDYTIAKATGVLTQFFWQDDGARGAKTKKRMQHVHPPSSSADWWPLRLNPSSDLVAWS